MNRVILFDERMRILAIVPRVDNHALHRSSIRNYLCHSIICILYDKIHASVY